MRQTVKDAAAKGSKAAGGEVFFDFPGIEKLSKVVFVSGTGTGVGKTVATGAIARRLIECGRDAITVKMVQTGNTGYSEDLAAHRAMMGGKSFPEDAAGLTAPEIFSYPASAELAARLEGRKVDTRKIAAAIDACAAAHEVVLVESAGGLMVPLDDETLTIDFAAAHGWPLILVTNGTLGSINHALLSLEAAHARGIPVLAVVYDWAEDVPQEIDADTPKAIARWLEAHGIDAPVARLGRMEIPAGGPAAPSPDECAALEYDRRNIWHPYASLANPPPVRLATAAHGLEIETAGGKRLIDAVSSWWCAAHGHNHPAIVEAIRRQSARLSHVMFGGFTHEPAVELARRLAKLAPPGLEKVFFADSGSIAVEVAVKMATQYQHAKGRAKRTKMLVLKGGYHGDTACAMALSDPDGMHTLFAGMMPKHFFAEKPPRRGAGAAALAAFRANLESVVAAHGDEIAGLICEPVLQAANAMNIYEPQCLAIMREIADANDYVLVFDEIATGFHRTGPRWACEHAGVAPDVMCVGKALTGGHITLAATIASDNVAAAISAGTPSAFMHGPTYMANPLACAAANASLELFERGDYAAAARRIENALGEALERARSFTNVIDVRTIGAAGIIEVERLPAREDIERAIDTHGVWLRPFSNFIYAMPPLVADDAAIARIADAMLDLAASPPGPQIDGDFHE